MRRALAHFYREGLVRGLKTNTSPVPVTIRATEKGLQEAGWPKPGAAGGDHLEILLRLLDEAIAAPETPSEQKTRLLRIRDSVVDAGRDLIVGVLSNYIAKQTGASG